ncbi:MAG: hypothetical protein ACYS8L_02940, partial [Planctomycetota bacterium]
MRIPSWMPLAACLAALLLPAPQAIAAEANPCRSVTVECRAGDRFLDVVYRLDLSNPTERSVDVLLLSSVDVLESVEGLRGELVLNKQAGGVRASVPPGWQGRITLSAKQRIAQRAGEAAFAATVAMPPAVSQVLELDLPGRAVEVDVSPQAVIRSLGPEGDRSRFRVVPLGSGALTIQWKQLPPPRPPTYSLHEVHRVEVRPPEYLDEATLKFQFGDTPPRAVSVRIPEGVSVTQVDTGEDASWSIAGGLLTARLPADFKGESLAVVCRLRGAAAV